MALRKNHSQASHRTAPLITHMPYAHHIPCYVLQFCESLLLTLANTSGQDSVKVTAEANTARTQTLRPSTPVHQPKTTHWGFHHSHCNSHSHGCPFPQFTRFHPTLRAMQLTTVLRLAHCMRCTSPAPPLPLTPHSLHPHFSRHNADGNQMPSQRCHTGCPAGRPDSPTEKESGSTDTIFTYWLLH